MAVSGWIPAFIKSYDAQTRRARVDIPGMTDGCEVFPEAEFNYAIGARSEDTEVRILVGDRVWVDFIGGDPRFPIIVGYRNPATDNIVDTLRLRQTNIELIADEDMLAEATAGTFVIKAGTLLKLQCASITLQGNVTITGTLNVGGKITGDDGISTTGLAENNGVRVGSNHTHTNVRFGTDISGPPQLGPP